MKVTINTTKHLKCQFGAFCILQVVPRTLPFPMISVPFLLVTALVLRIGFFLFGLYQDEYMVVKYTDIDYIVFTDAARYVANGYSPYMRETYRYTPLLAWMLYPTLWGGWWFSTGKFLFMLSDLVTGLIILRMLQQVTVKGKPLTTNKVLILSSIWFLNPMVITISTRGSSESVLTVMIMMAFYLAMNNYMVFAGIWMGAAIHFKLYPIIYVPSVMLYLAKHNKGFFPKVPIVKWINLRNCMFAIACGITLVVLNVAMYQAYGQEFLEHTYLYHLTRVDHRHNFSVYNVALYYKSAMDALHIDQLDPILYSITKNLEKLAFVPQLGISIFLVPLLFAQRNLISCAFIQTFAFVTFNKVMTSQYFIWFLIFLPHLLATSKLLTSAKWTGLFMLVLWIITQALWLYNAYKLEFLGMSTFDFGLTLSSSLFFLCNCYILGVLIDQTK